MATDALPQLPPGFRAGTIFSWNENRLVLEAVREAAGPSPGASSAERTPVVLKCLLPPASPEEEQAFRSEFLLLTRLSHPHWARPGRFGRLPQGGSYFTLDRAPGTTLLQTNLHGFSAQTMEVARQLLSALSALHQAGYAHLDLRPEQVIASADEDGAVSVVVTDLGLAAEFGTQIAARGTPGYVAPELLRGGAWDRRADLYAFGVLFFEIFAGTSPFGSRSPTETMRRQLVGSVSVEALEGAHLPPGARQVVLDLLAVDPRRRPSDALDTWRRLREDVPRESALELPPRLVTSSDLVFHGRKAELQQLLELLEGSEPEIHVLLRGELRIGKRRLMRQFVAEAQTRGWELDDWESAPTPFDVSHGAVLWRRLATPGGAEGRRRVCLWIKESNPLDRVRHPAVVTSCGMEGHTLDVGPLRRDDLLAMLCGAGMESELLRSKLVEQCLGSPGILKDLASLVPSAYDLAAQFGPPAAAPPALDGLGVGPGSLEWARDLLAGAGPGTCEALIERGFCCVLALKANQVLLDVDESTWSELEPLALRSLLIRPADQWQVNGAYWSRALLEADPGQTKRTAGRLLRRVMNEGGASRAVICDLGAAARQLGAVRQNVGHAIDELLTEDRSLEAIELAARVVSAFPSAVEVWSQRSLRRILDLQPVLLVEGGRKLPLEWCDESFAALSATHALLSIWAVRSRFGIAEARSRQEWATKRFAGEETLLFQIQGVRSLVNDKRGEEVVRRASELLELTPPRPIDRVTLRFLVGGAYRDLGNPARALQELALAEADLALLPMAFRLRLLHLRALCHWDLGQLGAVERDVHEAEAGSRLLGYSSQRDQCLMMLGGAAFQLGDLEAAAAWNRALLPIVAQRGNEVGVFLCVRNLGQIHLLQGRYHIARSELHAAEAWALQCDIPSLVADIRCCRVQQEAVVGRVVEALRVCGALPDSVGLRDSIPFAHALAGAGEAHFQLGEVAEGRAAFEQSASALETAGNLDDVADVLSQRILAEVLTGGEHDALAALDRLERVEEKASPLTEGVILLAKGEMELVGWRRSGDCGLTTLRQAEGLFRKQGHRQYLWRACWRVSQALARGGAADEARVMRNTAREEFLLVVDNLAEGPDQDAYLDKPVCRLFLKDLGEGE